MQALQLQNEIYDYRKQGDEDINLLLIAPKSNLRLLPLFYLIPQELFIRHKRYMDIYRTPSIVFQSDEQLAMIKEDAFRELVIDALAFASWQHMFVPKKDGSYREIPGGMSSYSGESPLWRLAYLIGAECVELAKSIGFNLQYLYNMPQDINIEWISYGSFIDYIGEYVNYIIEANCYQPMIDAIWNNLCHEDFAGRSSNAKTDYMRRWNHTRAKYGKEQVSLDAARLWQEDHISDDLIMYDSDQKVFGEVYVEEFMASLNVKDRKILRLRLAGQTYESIANKLGYKTHSAVIKHINKIGKDYERYIGYSLGFDK